ncbi:signal peptidase II [Mycoplasma sp. CSL7503-lung]|uniref:signal peptidase II n=1 Tax=Mycoplasma sp. CSL7503-lung TaxID=536372 RepID=UPI0021CE5CEC|nr:signal peptidase II [Mycoplasma sp. CSL7503-lung]MCU4706539.1 signal peptidase II [Mycoplasma sp. CSL7503-lung]
MNLKIKNSLQKISQNKKRILASYIVIFVAFIIFFSIDQLTKNLLFKHGDIFTLNNEGLITDGNNYFLPEKIYQTPEQWLDYKIIGVRSIWHGGVTFLTTRNTFIIQFIGIAVAIFVLISVLFWQKQRFVLAFLLGLVLAGDMGNAMDRFIFNGYVKDVFYTPFAQSRGTFNFADLCIFIGIVSTIIYSLFINFLEHKNEKNNKNQKLIIK